MKPMSNEVWTTNSRDGCISIEQFRRTPQAETGVAKLFFELLAENVWSSEFEVSIQAWHTPHSITISSPLLTNFFGDKNLTFRDDPLSEQRLPTVEELAKLLVDKVYQHRDSLQIAVGSLLEIANRAGSTADRIQENLARRMVLTMSPGVVIKGRAWYSNHCYFFETGCNRTLFVKDVHIFDAKPTVFEMEVSFSLLQEISSRRGDELAIQINVATPLQ